jgi:hypothetical protein
MTTAFAFAEALVEVWAAKRSAFPGTGSGTHISLARLRQHTLTYGG